MPAAIEDKFAGGLTAGVVVQATAGLAWRAMDRSADSVRR
jgi:hypothetical protein